MANGLDIGLAQLLVSHLCHELVSPIGAINNGVELLEELPPAEGAEEVVSLIGQSGRNGAAKLRCYRLAYGLAGANAGVTGREVRAAASDLLASEGRIQLAWPDEVVAEEYGARSIQLVLNMIMLAAEFLPRGGTISVSATPGGGHETVVLTVKGPMLRIEDSVAGLIAGRAVTPDHRSIHAAYCRHLADAAGLALALEQSGGAASLTTRIPLALPGAA